MAAADGDRAREHGDRLWKQLVLAGGGPEDGSGPGSPGGRSLGRALAFAVLAAIAVQVARLAADVPDRVTPWFWRDCGLLVLPVLACYFALRPGIRPRAALLLLAPVVVLGVTDAKGLEFDAVVVVDPVGILEESPRGASDLYVALTRATQRLGVVHTGTLPDVLSRLKDVS